MGVKTVDIFEIRKTLFGGFQVQYTCPHCEAQLRSSESEIGEQDWCPECRQPFRISDEVLAEIESQRDSAANEKARKAEEKRQRRGQSKQQAAENHPPGKQSHQSNPNQPAPQDKTSRSAERQCPYCAETIKSAAVKCRYCGQFVDGRPNAIKKPASCQSPTASKSESSGFQLFGIAITSIAAIALAAVLGGMLLMGACCIGMYSKSIDDSNKTSSKSVFVSRDEYGDEWPLTVESGTIYRVQTYGIVFKCRKGTFALNGFAQSRGFPEIAPIWRDDPNIPGLKVSIHPLIKVGLELPDQ